MNEAATSGLPWQATHSASALPHTVLGLTGGAIGQGLPTALGAALACPDRRVIAFQADGSGLYTVQALWSLAREAANVTVLICSNRKYRILQAELARAGVAEPGPKARALTELARPDLDWVSLARGFGVPGCAVRTEVELAEALRRALAEPGPALDRSRARLRSPRPWVSASTPSPRPRRSSRRCPRRTSRARTPTSRAATGSCSGERSSRWPRPGCCSASESRRACATGPRRRTRRPWLATALCVALLLAAIRALELPWSIYADFVREHQYGLSNQAFAAWLGEWALSLGVSLVLLTPALALGYAIARRNERTWWAWVGVLTLGFMVFGLLIAPVFIEPLFNAYTALPKSALRDEILSLARANGVPADDVFVVDASRQTTRISANVSGLLGTARIALNDNLLRQCSPAEIRSVMGHEIGHYALGHPAMLLIELGAIAALGLFLADRAFRAIHARSGARFGVRGISDPASLPLLYAALIVYGLATTPLQNTVVREHEAEADLFALNAVREPDAFATVVLKLGSYRKLAPGPLEEALLFDHPSGRSRILMAMRWKAEQKPLGAPATGAEPSHRP